MINSQGATQKYKKFEYLEVFLHAWLHFCTAAAIVLSLFFFLNLLSKQAIYSKKVKFLHLTFQKIVKSVLLKLKGV